MDTVAAVNLATKLKIDYDHHAKLWEVSKQQQAQYCKEHNINYARFVAARSRKLRNDGKIRTTPKRLKPRFIPVASTQNSDGGTFNQTTSSAAIILHSANGTKLELPTNLAPQQLVAIFTSIGKSL